MSIAGAQIYVHGRLQGVTRLRGLVARAGASLRPRLSSRVTHTVMSHSVARDYGRRRVAGAAISELAFKRMLGLAPEPRADGRMFSKADIVRLSGLDAGLVDRLAMFDILDPVDDRYLFEDIASAREVARLLREGAPEGAVLSTGARLRDQGMRVSEARLCATERGEILRRLDDRVTTLDGQFELDLGATAPDIDDLFDRAVEAEQAEEWPEAERLYRLLGQLDPGEPAYHFNLGNVLREQGRLDEALFAFAQAHHRDPHDADTLYNIGLVRALRGDQEGAERGYRDALSIEPQHKAARFNLALMLANAERYEEALPLWTAIQASASEDSALARKAATLCRIELRRAAGL